jgi:hypothetical protein
MTKKIFANLGFLGFLGLLGILFGSPHLYGFFGFYGFFVFRDQQTKGRFEDLNDRIDRRMKSAGI